MSAAANWSATIPTVTGTYLVQLTGDWFPAGDPNNIKHELVNVVTNEVDRSDIRVLFDGRFLEADEMKGWSFAKVRKVGAEESDEVLLALREAEEIFVALHDARLNPSLRRVRLAIKHYAP